MTKDESCPIQLICNRLSKGLTVGHRSFNPSTPNDEPSNESHFARDLDKIHYNDMREGSDVSRSTGSSRSVTDGDDPSTGSHFVRDLEKIHCNIIRESSNVGGSAGSSRSVTALVMTRQLEVISRET